ncbi:MAG: hypothetical protein PH343_09110, partial [Nitrospira sp.]|nr:hypothetical protein [Nitrospira sp.]
MKKIDRRQFLLYLLGTASAIAFTRAVVGMPEQDAPDRVRDSSLAEPEEGRDLKENLFKDGQLTSSVDTFQP